MKNYNKYEIDKIRIWKLLHATALKSLGCELLHNDNSSWNSEKDWDTKGKNYSGTVTLKITNGSLRNKEINKEDKLFFKNTVFPELCRIDSDITTGYNGIIVCHLRDNDLQNVGSSKNN